MSVQPVRAVASRRRKLGRYELICELASGGMGVVHLGRLQGVGGFERLFAIKVLHKHLASRRQIVAMLLDEARLAAHIQHPNVVSTVDAEVSSDGQYYVVMEYVDGFTLCELLDHPKLDAVRRVRIGLRVVLDAAAGLDAAHRLASPIDGSALGIVHRDLSPSNILISRQGTGMIADFGIARASAIHGDSLPIAVHGTPCYMAPEQIANEARLDARADVFSLGAVLWEVLTGEQLFYSPAGVAGVLSLVQNGEIEAPSCRNSRVPAALDAVCLKALARHVARRYRSARELGEELERIAREHDLIATTHEVEAALAQLFAEQIERRRAALPLAPAPDDPFRGEGTLIAPVPPPPLPPHSISGLVPRTAPIADPRCDAAALLAQAPEPAALDSAWSGASSRHRFWLFAVAVALGAAGGASLLERASDRSAVAAPADAVVEGRRAAGAASETTAVVPGLAPVAPAPPLEIGVTPAIPDESLAVRPPWREDAQPPVPAGPEASPAATAPSTRELRHAALPQRIERASRPAHEPSARRREGGELARPSTAGAPRPIAAPGEPEHAVLEANPYLMPR